MPKTTLKDLKGKRFGKWYVIKYLGRQYWLCRCECGKKAQIYSGNLLQSNTTQCNSCARTKYPLLKNNKRLERLHSYWLHMKNRNREIMCPEWANNFNLFVGFAVTGGYSNKKRFLILKDKKGIYEPENCEWSEKIKRKKDCYGCLITYNGRTHNLSNWAKELNISRQALSEWLKRGKTLEQAINRDKSKYDSKYRRIYGFTLKEMSERSGMSMKKLALAEDKE